MSEKIMEEQLGFMDELLGVQPEEIQTDVDPSGSDGDGIKGDIEEPAFGAPDKTEEVVKDLVDPTVDADSTDPMALLRDQIVKLTEQLNADPMRQEVQDSIEPQHVQGKKAEEPPTKLENFLTLEELDRVIDEPDVLNKAFGRAIAVIQQNMQGVIQAEVNRQVMVSRAVTDFYTANQDLAPYSKFVQFVMSEVEQANSSKTYAEIFDMTAKETRRRLGLGQTTEALSRQKSQPNQQRPAFAGSKKSTQRPAGKQEFFDSNAADMMNLL